MQKKNDNRTIIGYRTDDTVLCPSCYEQLTVTGLEPKATPIYADEAGKDKIVCSSCGLIVRGT